MLKTWFNAVSMSTKLRITAIVRHFCLLLAVPTALRAQTALARVSAW